MGQNKRYPHNAARLAEERQLHEARQRGPLVSLTTEQLRLNTNPVTVAPEKAEPWGVAWVRFGDTDVRATVRVKRWTDNAVGVEFTVDDDVLRCWVWQGAVTPLENRNDAWK